MPDGPAPHEPTPDEDAVRALLASLRDPDPVAPPEVAARLDARLADLTAARADGPDHPEQPDHPVGTVVNMPARPAGRRTTRGVLLAAAVAAVVGLGAVQVLDPLGAGSDGVESAGEAAVTADRSATAEEEPTGTTGGARDGSAQPESRPESARRSAEGFADEDPQVLDAAPADDRLPSLSTRSFALDVAALASDRLAARPPATACTPGMLPPDADLRPVLLDARPGVLVLHPAGTDGAAEGSRVAEAWQCRDLTGPAGTAAPPRVRVVVAAG